MFRCALEQYEDDMQQGIWTESIVYRCYCFAIKKKEILRILLCKHK